LFIVVGAGIEQTVVVVAIVATVAVLVSEVAESRRV